MDFFGMKPFLHFFNNVCFPHYFHTIFAAPKTKKMEKTLCFKANNPFLFDKIIREETAYFPEQKDDLFKFTAFDEKNAEILKENIEKLIQEKHLSGKWCS